VEEGTFEGNDRIFIISEERKSLAVELQRDEQSRTIRPHAKISGDGKTAKGKGEWHLPRDFSNNMECEVGGGGGGLHQRGGGAGGGHGSVRYKLQQKTGTRSQAKVKTIDTMEKLGRAKKEEGSVASDREKMTEAAAVQGEKPYSVGGKSWGMPGREEISRMRARFAQGTTEEVCKNKQWKWSTGKCIPNVTACSTKVRRVRNMEVKN